MFNLGIVALFQGPNSDKYTKCKIFWSESNIMISPIKIILTKWLEDAEWDWSER